MECAFLFVALLMGSVVAEGKPTEDVADEDKRVMGATEGSDIIFTFRPESEKSNNESESSGKAWFEIGFRRVEVNKSSADSMSSASVPIARLIPDDESSRNLLKSLEESDSQRVIIRIHLNFGAPDAEDEVGEKEDDDSALFYYISISAVCIPIFLVVTMSLLILTAGYFKRSTSARKVFGRLFGCSEGSGFTFPEKTAEACPEVSVTRAAGTLPASSEDAGRQAITDAGAIAHLNAKRIINGPITTAVAKLWKKLLMTC